MEGLDKIGFEVGWDHAEYGVMVPETLYTGTLADGHRAGMQHRGRAKPKEADRYIRKWLQLRRNAWRRERIFDDGVTPQFLRLIDVPYCPITREKLTYSTGEDSDWSVDRLVNDGGYVRGNLVVMSTRANKAKDTLTTKDIVDRAAKYDEEQKAFFLDDKPLFGLTSAQTLRLYTLTLIPHAGEILLAARSFVPPAVPCSQVYVFQCYLTALALLSTVRMDAKAALKKVEPGVSGINKVIRKITDAGRSVLRARALERAAAGRRPDDQYFMLHFDELMWTVEDVWTADSGVYEAFHKWVWDTPKNRYEHVIDRVMTICRQFGMAPKSRTAGAQIVNTEEFADYIGMSTGGYVRE
jgi:hypothetical protein